MRRTRRYPLPDRPDWRFLWFRASGRLWVFDWPKGVLYIREED